MASQSTSSSVSPPPRHYSVLAGFLSYLIPGLGQIYQGRVGKGVLFMVCLLGMFIGGQYLGAWQNVYLPDLAKGENGVDDRGIPAPWENNPFHLPPILHPLANVYHRWHFAGQFWIGMAAWPAVWQYNKLPVPANPFWRDFQKTPDENETNQYLTNSDKTPDVAWVYTVIAGVLNILVIYDAFAGPAYVLQAAAPPSETKIREEVAVT